MKRNFGVFFDHDGTLSDSLGQAFKAMCHVHEKSGVKAPTMQEFVEHAGPPYENFYRRSGVTASKDQIYAWYEEKMIHTEIQLFPDVVAVLSRLRQTAIVGIISAQTTKTLLPHCKLHDLPLHVDFICGSCLDKSEAIVRYSAQFGIDPKNVFYVGDLAEDVRSGLKAGVRPIGITRGCPTSTILLSAGAEFCIEHLDELFALVEK